MKKTLLTLLAIGTMAVGTDAAVLLNNPITGTNPNTANPYTTGQTVIANITVTGIGRGTGITSANASNRYNASSWNTAAIDLNAYFTFTLDANPGFEIDYTNFVYTGEASGTGPTSFAFRSSVDGFTANIGTPTAAGTTISLGASFQNLTAATEFRLYGFGASATGGTFSVNDFTFNGDVAVVVPEPTTTAMLLSGIGLMFWMVRRKRAIQA